MRHDKWIKDAIFSGDGSRILSWGEFDVRLWDAQTQTRLGREMRHETLVRGAAFSQDATRLLTWDASGSARSVGSQHRNSNRTRHDEQEIGLEVMSGVLSSSRDGRILTWGADGTSRLWHTTTQTQIGPAMKHRDPRDWLQGAVFNRDESRILTWGYDSTVRLWNAQTQTQSGPR